MDNHTPATATFSSMTDRKLNEISRIIFFIYSISNGNRLVVNELFVQNSWKCFLNYKIQLKFIDTVLYFKARRGPGCEVDFFVAEQLHWFHLIFLRYLAATCRSLCWKLFKLSENRTTLINVYHLLCCVPVWLYAVFFFCLFFFSPLRTVCYYFLLYFLLFVLC